MQNLLLTGIPRSGLTVVSALLDALPQSVTLNEPVWQKYATTQITGSLPYCQWLVGDFLWQRQQLLAEEPVRDFRDKEGIPLLDGWKDPRRIQNDQGEMGNIFFTRPGLEKDFTLTIKQHSIYTSMLPILVQFDFFKIVAVIRHPFDVIQSWQQQETQPFAKGILTIPPDCWPEVDHVNNTDVPALERMTMLYEAFCQRYHELHDKITIIKYEDVIKNPLLASTLIGASTPSPSIDLLEERPRILMREQTDEIRELLSKNGVFTKYFYEV